MKKLNLVKTLIVVLMLSLSSASLSAQDVYTCTAGAEIYKVEPDCSLTDILSGYGAPDIALSPTNIMYGIQNSGLIQTVNLDNGQVTPVTTLPQEFYGYGLFDSYVSLVCSNNQELYTLTTYGNLYKYDIQTDSIHFITNIDGTPGDLTFYKGNLIFQSFDDGNIKAYNLENGTLSTILCTSLSAEIYGITNLFEDCESERIIGFNADSNNLHELDFENGQIILLEDYEESTGLIDRFEFWGLTSTTEYLASECESYVFENIDCNEVGDSEVIKENIKIYPNPTDDYIILENTEKMTSLRIFSATGKNMGFIESNINEIDVSNFPTGVYFFQFYIDNEFFTKKVLVKKY